MYCVVFIVFSIFIFLIFLSHGGSPLTLYIYICIPPTDQLLLVSLLNSSKYSFVLPSFLFCHAWSILMFPNLSLLFSQWKLILRIERLLSVFDNLIRTGSAGTVCIFAYFPKSVNCSNLRIRLFCCAAGKKKRVDDT